MRYACIQQLAGTCPIRLMCRMLAVSPAGYYAWCGRPPSARAQTDARLRIAIRAIHAASRQRYGSPRVQWVLRTQQWHCSRKRVARLMRLDGLCGKRRRRYRATTQADGTPPAPNRLRRRFRVAALNRVWVGDVTACGTAEGWLYLAVVLDLASRRVIGWAAGATVGQELTLTALRHALARRRPPAGLVHHSDRGMHYTGVSYQRLLATHGGIASMSRRGDCWDNAVAESFFATLKTELETTWRSRAEGLDALRQYLSWYNDQRLHSTLTYMSPTDFERQLRAA